MWNLAGKDFKAAIVSACKEQDTMYKKLKEDVRILLHQIENMNTEI